MAECVDPVIALLQIKQELARLVLKVVSHQKDNIDEGTLDRLIAIQTHPTCLLYTSPSPRDRQKSRMPSSA